MVIPDLSAPETKPSKISSFKLPIASLSDRLLALVLDFLILTPVASLLVAGFTKRAKTFFLLDYTSLEGIIAALMAVGLALFFTIVLISISLFIFQASPGQLFLQLRVVAFPQNSDRLSLNQSVVRAALWVFSFLLGAVPFLEVLSHPFRRAFHERASDTMVITLKQESDPGPMSVEARFISSWMRLSFLLILFFVAIGFGKTYNSLLSGDFKASSTSDKKVITCDELPENQLNTRDRIDVALSLFSLNEISADCLAQEADAVLWTPPSEATGLAYVAKFVIAEKADQEKYLQQICGEFEDELCSLTRYMKNLNEDDEIKIGSNRLLFAKVLLSEEKYSSQDFYGTLEIIEELQGVPALKAGLEKRFVRAVWALNQTQKPVLRGRVPASAETRKAKWLEIFNERYDLP